MDPTHLQRLLTTARIGSALVYLPSTGSTMDDVRGRAAEGAAEGLVVVADEQTAGRGRLGRVWVAPPGVNLSLSILLRPSRERIKRLGMVAPLAVADAVAAVSGLAVQFKWPNDVRIGGRKVCGVLIESEFAGDQPSFAIVGIGLNVNLDTAVIPEIADIATSIAREHGAPVSREQTLVALLNAFERWYDEPEPAVVRSAWRERLETLGQEVEVTFAGQSERGVAEDVDAEGSLLLRRRDGSRVVLPAGEVTLRPGG
ncbi:MAG: biotin--[acetyl-CoA-carboxylase] ligase [Chloroflexi bacterium]|nr:biotin--[acetyl-CoA-carboxylase] ligase [Chloroflexota bacterium]